MLNSGIKHPNREVIKISVFAALAGMLWGYLPLHYMTENDIILIIGLSVLTCGITAAAMTLQSTSILIFQFVVTPCLLAQSLSFYMMDDLIYKGLSAAFILYLTALSFFAGKLRTINQQLRDLQQSNIQLIEELKVSLQKTEEADRAKSMFLASASHDLRQPVHAIGLFLETLFRTNLNEKQKQVSSHIKSAFDATREMLDVLLDFSKLDTGVIKADSKSFLLQPMLRKLEDEFATTADIKGLIYRTRATSFAAYSDPALVELILRNLIINAIRYTETGGVLIACRLKPKGVLSLEVWDTGIGISEINQTRIFQEFVQIGNPERNRSKGIGLGLSNAMGLSKVLQAGLSVTSRVGQGSAFSICIPLSTDVIVEDAYDEIIETRFAGKNVLFIDDDEAIRIGLCQLLESWGCKCMAADSSENALQHFSNERVDLLIVDYRLSGNVTGKDAIEVMKLHFRVNLPSIILTGDTASDRIQEALAADALLLHKPASSSELYRAMSTVLFN